MSNLVHNNASADLAFAYTFDGDGSFKVKLRFFILACSSQKVRKVIMRFGKIRLVAERAAKMRFGRGRIVFLDSD